MSNKMPPPTAILVVDDEEGMRTTLADILEEWVSRVDQAANGEEAVRLVLREMYDLVLMDVRMPVLDGIQALRRMHQHAPGLRVVLMTAYADMHNLADVREEVLAILPKPLNLAALRDLVRTAVAEKSIVCGERNT